MKRLFTSESVTEGHPDKVCDAISDSILDDILSKDKSARVACETCVTTGFVLVMGEITTECYVDVEAVARKTIEDIGYNYSELGFDAKTCSVLTTIHKQSPDIALGVDKSRECKDSDSCDVYDSIGAGDQGMMYGYASDETDEYMPLAIMLSHKLCERLARLRHDKTLLYLRPDGKAQVTVEYDGDVPVRVDTVVVSTQHSPDVTQERIRADVIEQVIKAVIPAKYLDKDTVYLVNPTGSFVVGGPQGDSGLTGRKIIVDTYGGSCPHGGGAFSGKDPTKVDRSAGYMARYICKNIVAAGIAKRCQLQISYAIGVAHPLSVNIDTYGTGVISDIQIEELVKKEFDLRPRAIIDKLDLLRPIYRMTTNYGHFGKAGLPWEELDSVEKLKKYLPALGETVASFEVDHNTLMPGFYTSRIDGLIYTYDLRFCRPNGGKFLENAALHTVEHQLASALRNGPEGKNIVYFGPMGCRTGFYLLAKIDSKAAKAALIAALERAISMGAIVGGSPKECGNSAEHDLTAAKKLMKDYLKLISAQK